MLGDMRLSQQKPDSHQEMMVNEFYTKTSKTQEMKDVFVKINGKIAYCQQNSAIFNMTIRDNICFGKEFNEEKYRTICEICCLEPDFQIMNRGDLAYVGSKGLTLSGGQKARI